MNPEIARAQVVSNSDLDNRNVAAYTCSYDSSSVMVVTNVTGTPKTIDVKAAGFGDYSELSGYVTGEDYIEQEQFRAYMDGTEYEVPDMRPTASPVFYVNGVLTLPPRTVAVLRNPGKVDSTFVTSTTTAPPVVSPSDNVTPTDITAPTEAQ